MRRLWILSIVATLAVACTTPGVQPTTTPARDLNHVRWSPRIGQGAEPRSDADFRRLAAEGYRVVLSVDGARTDLAAARRHGLRYVHVPLRYDGIDRDAAVAIVKAVAAAEGPVYVHCHHGRHRGPAAAALARVALDGIPVDRAVAGLMQTLSPSYPGLRAAVAEFRPPSRAELAAAPAPPARVEPSDLVEQMLVVDDRWEHLRAARDRGWRLDPKRPDFAPEHEARLLVEALTETGRLAQPQGTAYKTRLRTATEAAQALETALRAGDHPAADRAAVRVRASCTACHQALRN